MFFQSQQRLIFETQKNSVLAEKAQITGQHLILAMASQWAGTKLLS